MPLAGSGSSLGGFSGGNAVARLLVVISGESSGLSAAVAQAEGSMTGLGSNASTIGKSLTRNLTLPLVAVGAAAIKLDSDFQTAMARVAGLTPLISQQGQSIEGLTKSIMGIAELKDVAATPTALANALYFAGSAGLSAADALDVVKLSAQGASIGMGDASDISKILIFALNNYKTAGLTASHAMDVLTAAIKDGTAEPNELAIALGRLLPIAHEAGVSFDTVAASVASLTNLGVPTRVATTSLRALFTELLAPTQAATQKLNELGISSTELSNALKAGPLVAFNLLEKATHGNTAALHDIIPQIRGFTAFAGLTNNQMKDYAKTLHDVTNSTGTFQKALDIMVQTPQFKFQKSLQELQIAGIQLGAQLMPVFLAIVHVVGDLANAFSSLPGPLKSIAAAAIVIGAAAGPVLQLFGAMTAVKTATTEAGTAMAATTPTAKALTTQFGVMALAVALGVGGFESLAHGSSSLTTELTTAIGVAVATRVAFMALQEAANAGALGVNSFSLAILGLGGPEIAAVAVGLGIIVTVLGSIIGESARTEAAIKSMASGFTDAAKAANTIGQALDKMSGNNGATEAVRKVAEATNELGAPATIANLKRLEDEVGNAIPAAYKQYGSIAADFKGSTYGQLQNLQGLTEGQKALSAAIKNIVSDTKAGIAAHQLDSQSVQQLANQYGVSVPFMQQQLDNLGVTATGVLTGGQGVQKAFADAAGGIGTSSGIISLHAKEMSDAIQKAADDMSSSIQQSFDLFGSLPAKLGESIPKAVSNAQKITEAYVKQAAAIQKLNKQGVPTGLINQLVAKGPLATIAFANASKENIGKAVNAYEIGLAAMDAAVLKEGAHQEKKGGNMVQGFAQSMLTRQGLLQGTGAKIVLAVQHGLNTGKLKPSALHLITDFTNAIEASGMPKNAASKVVIAFANQLAAGKGLSKSGAVLVGQVATAISKAAPISKGKAAAIITAVTGTIKGGAPQVTAATTAGIGAPVKGALQSIPQSASAIGSQVGPSMAAGINAGAPAAVSAAQALAEQVKAALDKGMHNSPEYMTYYLGQRMVTDLARGLNSGPPVSLNWPVLTGGPGGGNVKAKDRGGLHVNIYTDGSHDPDQLMRAASRHFARVARDGGWDE